MKLVSCKSILHRPSAAADEWFGLDWNMNLYRGCCHGCIYCDSRSECYGIEDFDTVSVKENCLDILSKELKGKRKKGVVGIGSMSDPYNPFEQTHRYTRQALEWLDYFRFGISMVTKSALATRDIDLLQRINFHSPVIMKFTITCADDSLAAKIEPHVSPPSERFKAMREMVDAGIFTGVMLMPILPFINDTDNNISGIIEKAHKSGAKFIYPAFGVTLRANQRAYFYERLDESFPGLRALYTRTFGDAYACGSPRHRDLKKLFLDKCAQRGILTHMSDIITAYKTFT